MSDDVVIRVENLSKAYRIGHQEKADTFFGALAQAVKSPFTNLRALAKLNTFKLKGDEDSDDILWALKDVSFEVKRGEVLGIIGRNGAGKSTLLKILSRIAEPTRGRAEIRGRVSALLEVGTGFHPELTGRENIYLNGTILGMKKAEIDAKFDEIVDFSGVERFLDTPVKRYSSGMKVRLAFSVAAHLEPEILIIDEVLAVGDAEFQKKCLGKMQDVSTGEGRTVLFVSHNMGAVKGLCTHAILVQDGRKACTGNPEDVVSEYLSGGQSIGEHVGIGDLRQWPHRFGNGAARVVHAVLVNDRGEATTTFFRGKPIEVHLTIESTSKDPIEFSAICKSKENDTKILQLSHYDSDAPLQNSFEGEALLKIRIDRNVLQAGEYAFNLGMHSAITHERIDVVRDVLPFVVEDDLSLGKRPFRSSSANGYVSLEALWTLTPKA